MAFVDTAEAVLVDGGSRGDCWLLVALIGVKAHDGGSGRQRIGGKVADAREKVLWGTAGLAKYCPEHSREGNIS